MATRVRAEGEREARVCDTGVSRQLCTETESCVLLVGRGINSEDIGDCHECMDIVVPLVAVGAVVKGVRVVGRAVGIGEVDGDGEVQLEAALEVVYKGGEAY